MTVTVPFVAGEHGTDLPDERPPDDAPGASERFRTVFEAAPFGIEVTARGAVIDVNPALCEIAGRPREELLGRGVGPYVLAEDAERIFAEITASRALGETVQRIDSRLVRPDGTIRQLRATVVQIGDSGALSRVAHVEDVTDAHNERRALATAEAHLRSAFEGAVIGLCTTTADGVIEQANGALHQLLGAPPASLVGQAVAGLMSAVAPPLARDLGSTNGPSSLETGLRGGDGATVWVRWVQSPVEPDPNDPTMTARVFSQIVDITAGREAQVALEASHDRFEALLAHSADMVVVIEATGAVTYVSPAGQRLLGHQPGSALGRSFLTLVHPDDINILTAAFARMLEGDLTPVTREARISDVSGAWRTFEIVATNLLDNPSVAGIVANIRDISERAQTVAALAWRASHDPLTALANRSLLLERLAEALQHSNGLRQPVGVLFVDLDGFKSVNDTLGHQAGDHVLAVIAGRMADTVRDGDLVARLGGDEFIVLAEQLVNNAEGEAIAARLVSAIRQPIELPTGTISVSASIGVAFDTDDHTPDVLLRHADLALYTAKQQGKDRYIVHADTA